MFKRFHAVIAASIFFSSAATAQIIYTEVNPDAKFSCSKAGCSHQYNLDLNNDGINDFTITVTKYSALCGSNNYNTNADIIPNVTPTDLKGKKVKHRPKSNLYNYKENLEILNDIETKFEKKKQKEKSDKGKAISPYLH